MKLLSSLLLVILLTHVALVNARQTRDWINIAPADERFQVLTPQQPKVETVENKYDSKYGPRPASGTLYSTSFEGSTYMVWSLETLRKPSSRVDEIQSFLDEYADFVWESLLKPARDALPKDKAAVAEMTYKSELVMNVIPGREYLLRLGDRFGATRFYMDGARLYVLVALTSTGDSAVAQNFFSGFLAKSATETPFLPDVPMPEEEPSERVVQPAETATKAKVLSKPEPAYTDAARKYRVTGSIVLRAIISTDGRVRYIHILKRLPHGLTEAAAAAARQTRFSPATKDGLAVLQSIQFEYSFNLY